MSRRRMSPRFMGVKKVDRRIVSSSESDNFTLIILSSLSGRTSRRRVSPRFLGVKEVDRRRVHLFLLYHFPFSIIFQRSICWYNNYSYRYERTRDGLWAPGKLFSYQLS